MSHLQFLPFASIVEAGFWNCLSEKKLDVYKLDDSSKPLCGFYTNSDMDGLPCRHNVDYSAFECIEVPPPLCWLTHGMLINKNTIEDFKSCDKKFLLEYCGNQLWINIANGEAIKDPSLLVQFILLSFADLKKYMFHYWFAFPAFVHNVPVQALSCQLLSSSTCSGFVKAFKTAFDKFACNKPAPGFFLIGCSGHPFLESSLDVKVEIMPLSNFSFAKLHSKCLMFGFSDPSTMEDYPGWPLRNYLTLIAYHWANQFKDNVVEILCYRDRTLHGVRTVLHSLHLKIKLEPVQVQPNITGWEKNKKNKLGPMCVCLTNTLNPVKLAKSSVNLNLKLMRWRLMPELNLEKIANCRCLLLGSGTLGCNIARGLLAWGVNSITLVDNGAVSFSNPVRQTLYEFSDCSTSGGRPKAIAAAERLRKIYPGVNAHGIELSIPMPGHPHYSTDVLRKKLVEDVNVLENLIDEHDAIFLLMDTRESRWLPTLLCTAKSKLVINSALGFDSYLVMRHGIHVQADEAVSLGESFGTNATLKKLGCYFCNDVVGPGNSIRDRSLDQQCTVSRPGVSMIASALAVELLVSILQHPDGAAAAPDNVMHASDSASASVNSPLGPVPHQIRGFLSTSQVLYPSAMAFSKCTACSEIVLDAFQSRKHEFIMEVINSSHKYLEDLTGLTLLHQQTAIAEQDVLEFSDSESI